MPKKAIVAATKITSVFLVTKTTPATNKATTLVTIVLSFMIYSPFCLLKSGQSRKGEEKVAAFFLFAFNADASAVGENDFSRDAKA